ncbi:MAG: hypothetical protein ACJ8M1_15520 [Chthoniobacterales bacterium]
MTIAWPRWRAGMDWGDEGFLAYGAVRVMDGQIPNRDFVSLQPPLSFYTAAAMFRMFGTSVVSLRVMGVAMYLAIPLLIYGISRTVTSSLVAAAAAIPATVIGLPYFYFAPLAVWQGVTASLVAIFLFLQAILRTSRWIGFVAGVFTAASLLLRHDQGLYTFLSIVALWLALKRVNIRPGNAAKTSALIAPWLTGLAIIILPAVAYWWVAGALPAMFGQLIVFPLTVYGRTSSLPFHYFNTRLPISRNAVTALYFLPIVTELVALVWVVRRLVSRRVSLNDAIVIFFLVWTGLFYFQVLTRSDVFHLMVALPPFFVLAACVWEHFMERIKTAPAGSAPNNKAPRFVRSVLSVLAATGLVYFLWLTASVCLPNVTRASEILDLNRGGVRVEGARAVAHVIRTIQQNVPADNSILSLPYQPMFYFLTERRNPTRWNYLWPGDQTAHDHQILIAEAKRDPPAAVLITNEPGMAEYAPLILDYVHAEFWPAGKSGELTVYLPRNKLGEAVPP